MTKDTNKLTIEIDIQELKDKLTSTSNPEKLFAPELLKLRSIFLSGGVVSAQDMANIFRKSSEQMS